MKNIIIILTISLFFGCTQSSTNNRTQSTTITSQIDKITMEKIIKSTDEILTEEELKKLNSGNFIYPLIISENKTHGVLADGISAFASKVRGADKNTKELSNLIIKNSDRIVVSYNSDTLLKSIDYLSKTEEGRTALKKGRFIFADTSPSNIIFMNKDEIKELSQKHGFKYRYVE